MRKALIASVVSALIASIATSFANYQLRDANGTPQWFFSFVCQSIVNCPGQVIVDPTGNPIGAIYGYTPVSPMQPNLPVASVTGLTLPPGGANYAIVCASGANVNYSTDGTTIPSVTVGMPLYATQCLPLLGANVLANFKAIQQSATATLNVSYFK